jgi:LPXTG-motif cell wall-anchored protein
VYEPAEQGTPLPDIHDGQTWDVYAGKFWSTYPIGGGFGSDFGEKNTNGHTATLAEIIEETVCGAGILLSVQVGQGASTTGADALADELFFHGYAIPTDPEAAEPWSAVASAQGIDIPGEFAFEHLWALPPAGPGELPATGSDVTGYLIAGGALLLLGIAALVITRSRRRPA